MKAKNRTIEERMAWVFVMILSDDRDICDFLYGVLGKKWKVKLVNIMKIKCCKDELKILIIAAENFHESKSAKLEVYKKFREYGFVKC